MSPKVFDVYRALVSQIIEKEGSVPTEVLEIGAYYWSLLSMPELVTSQSTALNIAFSDGDKKALEKFRMVTGNANKLPFEDASFDLIMSCSTLEHDKYFWITCAEVHRVLRVGGYSIVGVPIYMSLPTDMKNTTLTYKRHGLSYDADFYRFSRQALIEVVFDGFEIISERLVRRYPNPYLVVLGRKK